MSLVGKTQGVADALPSKRTNPKDLGICSSTRNEPCQALFARSPWWTHFAIPKFTKRIVGTIGALGLLGIERFRSSINLYVASSIERLHCEAAASSRMTSNSFATVSSRGVAPGLDGSDLKGRLSATKSERASHPGHGGVVKEACPRIHSLKRPTPRRDSREFVLYETVPKLTALKSSRSWPTVSALLSKRSSYGTGGTAKNWTKSCLDPVLCG